MLRALTNKAGSASVEFALCLPLLITLLIGAEEFGRAFWCHHTLVQMTRTATRYLARAPDPTNGTYRTQATNLALYGNASGSGSARIPAGFGTGPVTLTYTVTATGGCWSGLPQYVTGTASFTFASAAIGWLGLDANLPMTVAHTERVQTD